MSRSRIVSGGRVRGLLSCAALLAALACTAVPPPRGWRDPEVCLAHFKAYESARRNFQNSHLEPYNQNATVAREAQLLRLDGCITRQKDIQGLLAAQARLSPHVVTDSGAPLHPPVVVQAGIVDGFTSQSRVTTYFAALGYNSRSVGAEGLGRQIFLGPFRSEGAAAEAIRVAREAGLISPYVSRTRY